MIAHMIEIRKIEVIASILFCEFDHFESSH